MPPCQRLQGQAQRLAGLPRDVVIQCAGVGRAQILRSSQDDNAGEVRHVRGEENGYPIKPVWHEAIFPSSPQVVGEDLSEAEQSWMPSDQRLEGQTQRPAGMPEGPGQE